jgi:hypothetical protein
MVIGIERKRSASRVKIESRNDKNEMENRRERNGVLRGKNENENDLEKTP